MQPLIITRPIHLSIPQAVECVMYRVDGDATKLTLEAIVDCLLGTSAEQSTLTA